MARIRSVKPSFWDDEKLAPMPPLERLVFLGLVTRLADDAGRLIDNVKAIDGALFSRTSDTSERPLEQLAAAGLILRYTSANGQNLIQLAGWKRHQVIAKPSKYVLPAPPRQLAATQEVESTANNSPEKILGINKSSGSEKEVGEGGRNKEREVGEGEIPKPPAVSPSLDSTEPTPLVDPPLLPHLPASVDPMPFLGAFYSRDCAPQRQVSVVRQLREALTPQGCRISHGVTVRTTPEVMQRGLDDLVRRKASIKKPDAAVVVLMKMLKEGRVNLDVNEHGETATEAASAREKASAAEDEAIHTARRERAATWAKRNPEAVQHITHRVDLRYGGKPVDGFKRAVYEQEILAACLKASENGTAPTLPAEAIA